MKKIEVAGVRFNLTPKVSVRVIEKADTKDEIKNKKKFPFKLENDVIVTVYTDLTKNKKKLVSNEKNEKVQHTFSIKIPAGYIWNGADIPKPLWWVGSSKDNDYLVASMVHDYMLEYKEFVYFEVLKQAVSVKEYRRLTSLIFREILKESDINCFKANIMAFCVDFFQATFNAKAWKIKTPEIVQKEFSQTGAMK